MESSEIDTMVGRNLKRLRLKKGISQERLAELIDTPATRLSAYENGREGMGKDIMTRICNALNIRPFEFYLEEDTPVIINDVEDETIRLIREARKLGNQIAENIPRYGKFLIEEIKDKQREGES